MATDQETIRLLFYIVKMRDVVLITLFWIFLLQLLLLQLLLAYLDTAYKIAQKHYFEFRLIQKACCVRLPLQLTGCLLIQLTAKCKEKVIALTLAKYQHSKPEKSTDGARASALFSNYGCWYQHVLVVINLQQTEYARSVFFINFLWNPLTGCK